MDLKTLIISGARLEFVPFPLDATAYLYSVSQRRFIAMKSLHQWFILKQHVEHPTTSYHAENIYQFCQLLKGSRVKWCSKLLTLGLE